VGSDIKAEGIEELVYPVPPLASFMRVTDDLLPAIMCPALILQSTEDHVVPRPTARISSKASAAKTSNSSGWRTPTNSPPWTTTKSS
jgi:hypothetical protein